MGAMPDTRGHPGKPQIALDRLIRFPAPVEESRKLLPISGLRHQTRKSCSRRSRSGALTSPNVLPGLDEIEPRSAIDLGKLLGAPRARRPLHRESVAADRFDIAVAGDGPCVDPLASGLSNFFQGHVPLSRGFDPRRRAGTGGAPRAAEMAFQ
jgi:hypothetical protein